MQEDQSITTVVNVELEAEGNIIQETPPKGKVVKKSGKRIGYNYIIYKSLKESQKNDVMKCIYIKGLFDFGTCVIKEGTLGDSKDKHGRDIKDRLIWQKDLHELLQDKVRIPRYLGSFEENGNYYLVIERIKGQSLVHIFQKYYNKLREGLITRNKLGIKFLGYLLGIIDLLQTLHQNHIVHRDASSNNFMITPSGKIALIDLELSYSLHQQFPSPPFQLGTHGFMSPQQLATEVPTVQEDIFALGAIIFQMWTYIPPSKIVGTTHEELIKKIEFFIPDQKIADIVIQLMHPEATKRPTLDNVRKVIMEYKTQLRAKRAIVQPYLYSKPEILQIIQDSIATYSTPLMADPEKGWFTEDPKEPPTDKNNIKKTWYASFNQGGAGVIYMLSNARLVGMVVDHTLPYVTKALDLIEQKYIDKETSTSPSLHFGSSGIATAITTAMHSGLIAAEPKYRDWINKLLDKENKDSDMIYGVSGQGIANMICHSLVEEDLLHSRLDGYVQQLLSEQRTDGSWARSVNAKKQKVIKGFAFGMSGIIYFLLEYTHRFNDKKALAGAELGLQWLMKKAIGKNGTIYWKSDSGKDLNKWWNQGLIGIALTFIKAYSVTSNLHYKKFATGILHNLNEKEINNYLSQNNGLSGLGEVYLEAFKTFKDPIWMQRADWIVQNILHLHKKHPTYGSYWLTGHERVPVASFMAGNSGVLHFLIRYCYPDKISFPLSATSNFTMDIIPSHIIQPQTI